MAVDLRKVARMTSTCRSPGRPYRVEIWQRRMDIFDMVFAVEREDWPVPVILGERKSRTPLRGWIS